MRNQKANSCFKLSLSAAAAGRPRLRLLYQRELETGVPRREQLTPQGRSTGLRSCKGSTVLTAVLAKKISLLASAARVWWLDLVSPPVVSRALPHGYPQQ